MKQIEDGQELPAGWIWTTIGAVTERAANVHPEDDQGAEFTYIDISSIDNDRNRIAEPKRYTWGDAPSRARQLVKHGDTLLSTVRVYLKNTALVAEPHDGAIASTGFCVIRPVGIDSKYVYYFTLTDSFVSSLSGHQRGVSYPAVRDRDVFGGRIPLAPLPEQRRIVEKIEELFSDLDAGVQALQEVRRQLKLYRQSVLKAAVEGELTREWREQHGADVEPAEVLLERILAERRARWEADTLKKYEAKGTKPPKDWKSRYQEPAAPDTTYLPELPEGWTWTNMDHIVVSGPQNGLYLPKSDYGNGMPILRIDDYQNDSSRASGELRRVSATPDDVDKYQLQVRDLVINRVNSPSHLGKCLLVAERNAPALFESNMMRLRVAEAIDARHLTLYLQSIPGRHRLTADAKWAVNQASINQGDVAAIAVPLPPLAEQRAIVEAVEERLSVADAAAAEVGHQLRRAEKLRRSILQCAFEGKLVPQHPHDEPASALLKRIESEKEAPTVPPPKRKGNPRQTEISFEIVDLP